MNGWVEGVKFSRRRSVGGARLGGAVLNAEDVVGESAIWSARDQALYWVDIGRCRIQRFDPANGAHQSWQAPEIATSIGICATGGFVVGLRRSVCWWEPGGAFGVIAIIEPDVPDNRLNEGRVAPDGSFWVGTMQDNIGDDGSAEGDEPGFGRLLPHRSRRRGQAAHAANLWHHQYDGVVAGWPLRRSRYDEERALCLRLSARRPKHIEPARLFGRLPARISRRLVSRRRRVPMELPCCRRCLRRCALRRTGGSIALSSCPAPGRRAAHSAGRVSPRCS